MFEWFEKLFSAADFAPHIACIREPSVIWMHIIADLMIGIAYYSIPFSLLKFVKSRKDLAYNWMFQLFGLFIFLCGTTHFVQIWVLYYPVYRFESLLKLITGIISVMTAYFLIRLIPTALKLRSPKEFEESNKRLEKEVQEHKVTLGELRSAQGELQERLQEKDVLIKEIHHRVKNNLQIISSLLNLQVSKVPRENAEAFTQSQNRIQAMAMIHQMLYQTRDLARLDFETYMNEIAKELVTASGRMVELSIHAAGIRLDVDQAVPCGLLFNELLTNSLKYTKNEKPKISILLKIINDNYELTVEDNGPEFPPDLKTRQNDTLGLQLVTALTRQLRGTMTTGTSISLGGALVTVTFPREL